MSDIWMTQHCRKHLILMRHQQLIGKRRLKMFFNIKTILFEGMLNHTSCPVLLLGNINEYLAIWLDC